MLPRLLLLLTASAFLSIGFPSVFAEDSTPRSQSPESLVSTPQECDSRLGWWREARFGMFVHWGVYSVLAGTWHGRVHGGYSEHIQRALKIPISSYRTEVAGAFNPTAFDPDEWIRLAKESGMGYFIITAKHHDGFAMYDSKASDYNVVKATPFARDPMPGLRDACRKYGIKFGFYYSHAFDWGEENGPGNDWDYENPGGDRLLHGRSWWKEDAAFLAKARDYVDRKVIPQLQELIRNYHPDILWFDTPHKLPPEETMRILAAVRKEDPRIVVNGRVVTDVPTPLGDYQNTADKPAEFPPTPGDWEGIPTTNESYGYNSNDLSHKPPAHFIRLLAKAAARGGNILLNVGPRGDGSIDPKDVSILEHIAAWWKINGESIRSTERTPLPVQAWGESTRKGNVLYLHVFQWPTDGNLTVGGLRTPIAKARLLADPANPLQVDGDIIKVPPTAPDPADSVIAIECTAEPVADPHRLLVGNVGTDTLRSLDAKLEGALRYGPGKSRDAWVFNWRGKNDALVWPVHADEKLTFEANLVYDAPEGVKSQVVEGDAGKEKSADQQGAGGKYAVVIGSTRIEKSVRTGADVTEPLGLITVQPGDAEIRIETVDISGGELFRPKSLQLSPVRAESAGARSAKVLE